MNGALRATARSVPNGTILRVAGGVAVGCAITSLAVATLLRPYLGTVVGYAIVPLLGALIVWGIAGLARLRLVGFLPSDAHPSIPPRLQPWIRWWLLSRFGLLGSAFIVFVIGVVMAFGGGPFQNGVDAFVYIVMARIFMDLAFGAAFNIGIITRRHSGS